MHFHIKRISYQGFGECSVIYLPICLNPFSYGYECSGRQDGQLRKKIMLQWFSEKAHNSRYGFLRLLVQCNPMKGQ